jgi:hypothetical protein
VVPAGPGPLDDLAADGIRGHAAAQLPSHMCPESIIGVPRIPSTVNGKIDNRTLIEIWQRLTDGEREIVPPADDLEAALVDIYRRVLETESVSMTDSFALLGGHSVLAFKVLDECAGVLRAQPDPAQVLGGTLSDVAASIRAALQSAGADQQEPDDRLQPAS